MKPANKKKTAIRFTYRNDGRGFELVLSIRKDKGTTKSAFAKLPKNVWKIFFDKLCSKIDWSDEGDDSEQSDD